MSQKKEEIPKLLKETYTTHNLPCKMKFAQSCTIKYENQDTIFIFGSYAKMNIYKYNLIKSKYELFDKYKTFFK